MTLICVNTHFVKNSKSSESHVKDIYGCVLLRRLQKWLPFFILASKNGLKCPKMAILGHFWPFLAILMAKCEI